MFSSRFWASESSYGNTHDIVNMVNMASDDNGKDAEACAQQPVATNSCPPQEKISEPSGSKVVAEGDTMTTETKDIKPSESPAPMELGADSIMEGAYGSSASGPSKKEEEILEFKVVFNKQKYDICFPVDETVAALKKHMETLTGVPPSMQKVMYKGLAKDDKSLRDIGLTKGAKVMVVGSTLNDILAVNTPSEQDVKDDKPLAAQKEPLCKQKMHKKILDKGIPEDVQPGIKNVKDSLPPYPLSGMLNKSGGKVRLTFKLELDQLWIGTKERTDKIPMNSIKNVISESIEDHEEYHIMGIQLGTTEASRYWIYWVPAQYVDAIKEAILGKWQYF